MAEIYPFKDRLSVDDKWEICKSFYEKAYSTKETPFRFKQKPSVEKIKELFLNIGKLQSSLEKHFVKKPKLEEKYYRDLSSKKDPPQ